MKKADMAYIITHSPVWDGASAQWLMDHLTKEQLQDVYDRVKEAEEDYYEGRL